MSVNDLVLVQGMHDTRITLERWNKRPWHALGPWLAGSVAVSLLLLFAIWVIAERTQPDVTPVVWPGLTREVELGDYIYLLERNGLVLALHALACVAGFMAGSSLPLSASKRTGLSRWVHEKAGPFAIAFVTGATLFSLATQAYVIGSVASTTAWQLGISPAKLLLALSIHAIPELTALFLPLAAWLIASRRGRWEELLAATFVTVAVAVPVLLASAAVELFVTPEVIARLVG